jgi:hypothetical protein
VFIFEILDNVMAMMMMMMMMMMMTIFTKCSG